MDPQSIQGQARQRERADGLRGLFSELENVTAPSICRECAAVYLDGHWQWIANPPAEAMSTVCPACQRIHDRQPAGTITLQGKFAREHCDELLSFIRNLEVHQKSEHPLQRIMSIDKRADKLLVSTTDTQLARSIGKALHHVYKGNLDFNYHKSEHLLRALWQR